MRSSLRPPSFISPRPGHDDPSTKVFDEARKEKDLALKVYERMQKNESASDNRGSGVTSIIRPEPRPDESARVSAVDPGFRNRMRNEPETKLPGILGLGQNIVRGFLGDLQMGFAAGLGADREKQRTNLLAKKEELGYGNLSDFAYNSVIDDYFRATDESKERMARQLAGSDDDDDPLEVTVNPCPVVDGVQYVLKDGVCSPPEGAETTDFYDDDLTVAPGTDMAALSPYTQVTMGDAPVVPPFQPLLPPNQRLKRPGELMPYTIDIFDTT